MLHRPLKRFFAHHQHPQRRLLAGLAFAAMLLLLVMPTTGRLLGVLSAGNYGMPHAMAMAGHAMMARSDQPSPTAHAGHAGHPDHGSTHPDNGTCGYCPLLASMLTLALFVALLAIAPVHGPVRTAQHLDYVAGPRHGLGARGPPAPL